MALIELTASFQGNSETQARCGRIVGLSVAMKSDEVDLGFGPPKPPGQVETPSERPVEPRKE